jgi:hypothetical protein
MPRVKMSRADRNPWLAKMPEPQSSLVLPCKISLGGLGQGSIDSLMIIFLDKLKIVENTPKNEKDQNKTSMANIRLWECCPSEIHMHLLGSPYKQV